MNGSLVSVAQHPTQIHKAGNSQYSITVVVLVTPNSQQSQLKEERFIQTHIFRRFQPIMAEKSQEAGTGYPSQTRDSGLLPLARPPAGEQAF